MDMANTFGALLRHFRLLRGLTKTELAEALGAGRMSVIDWEKGARVPRDRARILDLAQVLQLSAAETDQLGGAARQKKRSSDGSPPPVDEPLDALANKAPAGRGVLHQLRPPIPDF